MVGLDGLQHCQKQKVFETFERYKISGSVYTGQDPFGTGTKLVRISLLFTRDMVDPDRICYLVPTGSTYKGDPMWNRTVQD